MHKILGIGKPAPIAGIARRCSGLIRVQSSPTKAAYADAGGIACCS